MIEKSLKRNSLMNFIKTILGLIFPLITFPYVSRVLGVSNLGQVNFANTAVNYFVLIAGLGISNYAIREGAKIRDNKILISKFSIEMLIINMCSTLLAYIGIVILIQIKPFASYKSLILILSSTIFFNLIGISWLFNIYEEFTYITVRSLLMQCISLIILILFVKTEDDYLNYAGVLVVSSVGANLFNVLYARKFITWPTKCRFQVLKHLKPILIIFGVSVTTTIYLNLDITMLGILKGDYEVGLYSVATKINKISSSLISSVCAVFLPRLSYYIKNGKKMEFKDLVDKAFFYILGLTIPASIGLLLLSREIIYIFSGSAYLNAVPAMMIKAPNIILSVLNGFVAIQLFMPLNMEKESLLATISGALLNCLLNYLLIPIYGAAGAAIATVVAEGSVLCVCLFCLKGIYPLRNLLSETWKYVVGGIGILGAGLLIKYMNLGMLLTTTLTVISSICVYFIILTLLKAELISAMRKEILKGK